MLSFLTSVASFVIEPVTLAAGIAIGYLFHRDWKQLAWPLLLFIVPGMGGLEASNPAHGAVFLGTAQFIAVCLVTFGFFWAFQYFAHRPARHTGH